MPTLKPRVFSGVQPTGNLHLGNYLGAIKRFVEMQESHDCLYCVVDLHAITVWQDPRELARNTREVTAAFLAAGIDPQNHIVFNQSQVPEHAELAWILNCVARLGWLNRMTQFKDKAGDEGVAVDPLVGEESTEVEQALGAAGGGVESREGTGAQAVRPDRRPRFLRRNDVGVLHLEEFRGPAARYGKRGHRERCGCRRAPKPRTDRTCHGI